MKKIIFICWTILLLGNSLADAAMLYINSSGSSGSHLYSLATDGASIDIGQVKSGNAKLDIRDIGYNPVSGTMYAITTGSLYTLDFSNPTSGVVTASLVGHTKGINSLQGLTVAKDGTIYAGSRPSGHEGSLYTLSSTTGEAMLVGSFGLGNGSKKDYLRDYGDLAFSPIGSLYGMFLWNNHDEGNNYLGTVSTATGVVTNLVSTGKQNADGLAFIGDTLYSVGPNKLYIFDPSNGELLRDIAIAVEGKPLYNISGMTSVTQTPLPSTILLLGSGLVCLGVVGRRQRS